MNELQIFTYESNDVRIIWKDKLPWWVLKDVCVALGLSDTNKVAERLDEDELTRIKLMSGGQYREMYVINESGLYNVIFRSEKPEAKEFKRWITHEVLPSIRKTGGYTAKKSRAPRSKPVDIIFRQRLNMARDFSMITGVPLGIAVAKAIADAEKLTGEDYTHWKLALPARTDEKLVPHLNATNLGALIGLSAQDTNKLLESEGLQVKFGKQWHLTEAGKKHGEEYPYERHGHSDYCIRWCESIADFLREVEAI
jgi:prophage antirepressor-like protein